NERDDEHHDEDEEQDLPDVGEVARKAAEPENARDQSQDEEQQREAKHDGHVPLSADDSPNHACGSRTPALTQDASVSRDLQGASDVLPPEREEGARAPVGYRGSSRRRSGRGLRSRCGWRGGRGGRGRGRKSGKRRRALGLGERWDGPGSGWDG